MGRWLCPACRAPLRRSPSKHNVFPCAKCAGVWTDGTALEAICEVGDASVALLSTAAAAQASVAAPADVLGRPCPVCSQPLAQMKVAGGVSIDRCKLHGGWFDRGEIERVLAALKALEEKRSSSSSAAEGLEAGLQVLGIFAEILGAFA